MERILAKISPQPAPVSQPEFEQYSRSSRVPQYGDALPAAGLAETGDSHSTDDKVAELLRLKQELLAANSKIAMQEQELAQNRVIKHTLDQALGPPSEAEFGARDITEKTISNLQNAFNASNPTFGPFQDAWNTQDDSQSDISDALSAGAYNRTRGLWKQNGQSPLGIDTQNHSLDKAYGEPLPGSQSVNQESGRFWGAAPVYPTGFGAPQGAFQPQRIISGPSNSGYGLYHRPPGEQSRFFQAPNPGPRCSLTQGGRGGPIFPVQNTAWGPLASGSPNDVAPKSPGSPTSRSSSIFQPIGVYPVSSYHGRPGPTALSPTASEFTTGSATSSVWTNTSVRFYLITTIDGMGYLLTLVLGCRWTLHANLRVSS